MPGLFTLRIINTAPGTPARPSEKVEGFQGLSFILAMKRSWTQLFSCLVRRFPLDSLVKSALVERMLPDTLCRLGTGLHNRDLKDIELNLRQYLQPIGSLETQPRRNNLGGPQQMLLCKHWFCSEVLSR
eukprot:scaffold270_cov347-Pavlova_lutheri.AAC.7